MTHINEAAEPFDDEKARHWSACMSATSETYRRDQEQQAEIERLKAELGHVQMKYEHVLGKVSGGRLMHERPKEPDVSYFLLLEIGNSTPPVYAVLEKESHPLYATFEHWQFVVEEHTCPTNLIDVPSFIMDGNTDNHDILTLVDLKMKPETWDQWDGEWPEGDYSGSNNRFLRLFSDALSAAAATKTAD